MSYQDTKEIINYLEKITSRGHNHYQVFEDWLELMLTALMADDKNYLEVMGRYANAGEYGKREADCFKEAFHKLMEIMKLTNEEQLGEIYQSWNIQNKYNGQFFTPKHLAKFLCEIAGVKKGSVLDPACGAGIMLIEGAKLMSDEDLYGSFFVGQDIDGTCVKMCALNMCFFNLNGYAIQGDTLAMQYNYGYRTIRTPLGGDIRMMTEAELEETRQKVEKEIAMKQEALF